MKIPEGGIDGVGGRGGIVEGAGPPQPVHQIDRIGDIQRGTAIGSTTAGIEFALLLGRINGLPVTLHLGMPGGTGGQQQRQGAHPGQGRLRPGP